MAAYHCTKLFLWDKMRLLALLLQNGAEMDATDNQGKTPLNRARVRPKYTHARAAALQIKLDPLLLENARRRVVNLLSEYENTGKIQYKYDTVWRLLTTTEIFVHLWFLWFLCWLLLAFVLYAAIVDRMQWTGPPQKFILSPLRYLWVIPLTMLAQWFMAAKGNVPTFGPDFSSTILPAPYMLVYYGIFFFFGVLYYDSDDCAGKVGKRWAITLPIAVSIIFPLGLTFGVLSFIEPVFGLIPGSPIHHLISVAMQAMYAWADGLLPYGGFSSIDVERKQEVAIHLGLLLLAIPCALSLSHRGATGSANVASATDCQVQSDMYSW